MQEYSGDEVEAVEINWHTTDTVDEERGTQEGDGVRSVHLVHSGVAHKDRQ